MDNESKEHYLKCIYRLHASSNSAVRCVDIAEQMKVSKASVNGMIKRLSKMGLVEHSHYGAISLTDEGIRQAEEIVYKHRIIEAFLEKFLGFGKKKVHEEAHKLEHGVSKEAAKKLEAMLHNPKTCPHGGKIPHSEKKACLLADVCVGKEAEILFSKIRNKELLERINSIGLVPETKVKVVNKIRNGPLKLEVKGFGVAVGGDICGQIYVKEL
jgi:DtxR family Mn-dependent transcriptional regulator